jgi:salicylate 5-hydroxylase small subunit
MDLTRAELETLYAEASSALDDGDYERFLSCFAAECVYAVTSKENIDRRWPIRILSCESRGMLVDRVFAIQKTLFYTPRVQRRMVSGLRVNQSEETRALTQASFVVFETIANEPSTLYTVGCYKDVVVREGGALKLAERICIIDSPLIANSLPFPL